MPTLTEWWAYLAAAMLIAVTPGPGLLYVLARSVRGGRSDGVRSALGNALGASVHVVAAAFGLSVLLAASAVAFTMIKLVGAAYLVWLGARALIDLRTASATVLAETENPCGSAIVQGLVAEVCNPKTAIFFFVFIPQFVHSGGGSNAAVFLLLGAVFVLCTLFADVALALVAGPLASWLARKPGWWRRQQAFTGVSLIGLGGALACTSK